jgi:hypothetical protein
LSSWADNQFAKLAAQSAAAAHLAEALYENGTVTLDVSAPLKTTIEKLPPSLIDSLKKVGDLSKTDPVQLQAAFVGAIKNDIQKLDQRLDEFSGRLENEINPIIQQYERQRRLESIQAIAQDINSIGLIGNLVFSQAFDDASIGRKIQGFAAATASIYVAFATSMSFLGIAGVLAGAAISIINLFSEEHDPVLEALNSLH